MKQILNSVTADWPPQFSVHCFLSSNKSVTRDGCAAEFGTKPPAAASSYSKENPSKNTKKQLISVCTWAHRLFSAASLFTLILSSLFSFGVVLGPIDLAHYWDFKVFKTSKNKLNIYCLYLIDNMQYMVNLCHSPLHDHI